MPDEAQKKEFQFPIDFLSRLMELSAKNKWVHQKRKNIESLFQNCTNVDEASVILHSIELFKYIDGDKLEEALELIAAKIAVEWNLAPDNTRIVCKDIEGKTDSSAALQQMIKSKFPRYNGWSSNKNFPSNLEQILNDQDALNIVIVDDFSGTGNGLQKLCAWIDTKCNDLGRAPVNVYAAFVGAMQQTFTLTYINLKEIYCFVKLDKVISAHFPNDGLNEKAHMVNYEKNHGNIHRSYSLGYKKSEAAFYVQNLNTPNNVLPIFWKDGETTEAIFPRLNKN